MGGPALSSPVPAIFMLLLVLIAEASTHSAGGEERYVYEVIDEYHPMRIRHILRLTRMNQSAFRIELLHAEPEDQRVLLERELSLRNWTVSLEEVYESRRRALHLLRVPFPLYLDPDLIRLACERAGEVERAVRVLLDPNARPEERERVLSQLRYPNKPSLEWLVISMLVGDPYIMAGMQSYYPVIAGASYSLSARCGGNTKTFSYVLRHAEVSGRALSIEVTSSYSSAGWLLNAKFTQKRGDSVWVREVRLIETSNQEVVARSPDILRVVEELASNPQALVLVTAVVAAAILAAVLKSRS